jgi:hypothetical protein
MFVYKKMVLEEPGELIQWYIPLVVVCADLLEKGSVYQDS